jgi:UDP-N-acetylmuramoyl-tripeptide--D-alanyl-D-alanine ligase
MNVADPSEAHMPPQAPAGPRTFWTLDRAADALTATALGASPRGSDALNGVSTDTRSIAPGALFVALAGENFDAHDFLPDAVSRGAAALVVSRPERAEGLGVPVFAVSDTLRALGALGAYRRRLWGKTVVGVVGSNGKTTTKEMIRSALGTKLTVHATTGNLNNLVGVPLTLLAIPDGADIAVIEMGTNAPGEVATLRDIVRPDIVVVTSVGEEHLEGLGDLDAVLREEVSACDGARVAITPAFQPEIGDAAQGRAHIVVRAGLEHGDVRADRAVLRPDGCGELTLGQVVLRVPVRGAHNMRNAMLAIAAARACGVSDEDAARGISGMPQPSMRTAWETLGRATLINDAYNANPGSMRAAIDLLAVVGSGRQRVAVLGTMRELGDHALRCHEEVARHALAAPVDVVAGIGEMGVALQEIAEREPAAAARVVTARDVEELWAALESRLAPDATILLKASRGVRLERLLPHLQTWATR